MNQSVAIRETTRNSVPTIQCRVQKHNPANMKMSVAAMVDSNFRLHCTVNCMEVC